MERFTEKKLVEDYLIDRLREEKWKFIPAEELERSDIREPLLIPTLTRALKLLNKDLKITDEEIYKVINTLTLTPYGIEGIRQILEFLKSGVPVKFEKERVVGKVRLLDTENPENNECVVSRQVWYEGREPIRTDIMLYINGIPLVNIECKSPTSLSQTWRSAYQQIKHYEKVVPELYKYVQIGVAAEAKVKYFPIIPGQEEVHIYEWKENELEPLDAITRMLEPKRLLDIIKSFLFFREEKGVKTKVIARYMQYRAANRIVDRVLNLLYNQDTKNKGLIWHWQGSGKTLTMIFAANKLFYLKKLENPTIFFIVDRIELEEQLSREFYALDICKPEVIGSIKELKEIIKHNDYQGKRGIFITLIHKFRPEEFLGLQKELKEISRYEKTIMNRKNVILFVDEGHRTQYGILAAQMKGIFKNGLSFAFTGTPIAKTGRDTYYEFSYPPKELYLDKYFVVDSLRDGFTVKIVYQPRLEKDVHLKRELLEAFLEMEFEELPEEIKGKIAKRVNEIRMFLENPKRIRIVAEDISKHFKENLDGRFKAMVVTASRKACIIYKQELDKYLPRKYSQVVMTYMTGDKKIIQDYKEKLLEKFRGKDIDDIRKEITDNFKEREYPKILIVTDMLLTGFDAPMLQTMYLDKPLKEHRLLQAIARTNRPYKGVKEAGLIIDYVGILRELKRAFRIYSEDDVKEVLRDYNSLRIEFVSLLRELMEILKDIPREYERETLLKAFERITLSEEIEKKFTERYWALRKVFEMLGPHEVKLEYFEHYKWLSAIYVYYLKQVVGREEDKDVGGYFQKTIRFIHKSTEIEKLERELPVIEFDDKYLEKLEKKVRSEKEKAANVLFTLNRLVLVEKAKNPIYDSLVERVERLVKLWREKTKDYKWLYQEGVSILEERNRLFERKRELGFSDTEYALLLALEERLGRKKELIEKVRTLFQEISSYLLPGWAAQGSLRKKIEKKVREFVRKFKVKYGLSLQEIDNLYDNLMNRLGRYGV